MKTQYITIWCLLINCLMQAQSFNRAQGQAKEISLDKKGRVYIIDTRNNPLIFNTGQKRFFAFNGTPTEVVNGQATVYNPNYTRYTTNRNGASVIQNQHDLVLDLLQTQKHVDVCLTSKDGVWAVKSDGKIYYYQNGSLRALNKGGTNNWRIAGIDSNTFYTVKRDKSIWLYKYGKGTKLSGAALDISFDHLKNKLYVIGTSKRVFVRNTAQNKWELIRNTRNDFIKLSVHNTMIWAITTNGSMYSNDINGAVYDYFKNTGNRDYKLKVTLLNISCSKAWDNDKKDDYMVSFKANVKGTKNFTMERRDLKRISGIVKGYGSPNSLYIRRNKGIKDHAAVQLHVPEKRAVTIDNSGVFEIPKFYINKGNVWLETVMSTEEVSERVTPIFNRTQKLNLKEIVKYLSHTKPLDDYKIAKRVHTSSSTGSSSVKTTMVYYDMGSGFESVHLGTLGNRRVANVTVSGSKSKSVWGSTKTTSPNITYRVELVD
ncbi:hypothetical protein ACOKFD_06895 [Flagellimonas sp. S174]|uniref:hypothetical protein n=1 Tax=Flagellimonas sp. S174 TaxID=3410790 RepID=UPI003BF5D099